jgi:hypothetical protein
MTAMNIEYLAWPSPLGEEGISNEEVKIAASSLDLSAMAFFLDF